MQVDDSAEDDKTVGSLSSLYGFHRLIYDFAMTLLWLYYDFAIRTPYV